MDEKEMHFYVYGVLLPSTNLLVVIGQRISFSEHSNAFGTGCREMLSLI